MGIIEDIVYASSRKKDFGKQVESAASEFDVTAKACKFKVNRKPLYVVLVRGTDDGIDNFIVNVLKRKRF